MSIKVAYAIVRIETDKDDDFKSVVKAIQNSEREVSTLTLIDVYGLRTVNPEHDDESPVLYWP